jgi:DNA (cytosine-5)-methyltransferase 1
VLRHGDAFAGIGGFGLAARRVGWETVWACEIEPSARAVYSARLGHPGLQFDRDIRDVSAVPAFDVLTGGFPCQDISVAGARKGLAGERSGLFFQLVRVLALARPECFVFENVDGLLSSPDACRGRDLGLILSTLVECGYGVAWRVLNSRFFGLAQRRARVFIVGHRTDWRVAASILFESASGGRNPAKGRKARREDQGADPVGTLTSSGGRRPRAEDARSSLVVGALVSRGAKGIGTTIDGQLVAHTLTSDGFDASEDGTGRGSPIVIQPTLTQGFGQLGSGGFSGKPPVLIPALVTRPYGDAVSAIPPLVAATLSSNPHRGGSNAKTQAHGLVVVSQNQRGEIRSSDVAGALSHGGGIPGQGYQLAAIDAAGVGEAPGVSGPLDVCPQCTRGPDAPRYQGLGNAISVPVAECRWGNSLDAAPGGTTRVSDQLLTDVEYELGQRAALMMALTAIAHDFNAMLIRIEHTHALAPIVDPTSYRKGMDRLMAIERLVRAAAAFRVVALEVAAVLEPEVPA